MKKMLTTFICAIFLTSLIACKTEFTAVPSVVTPPENSDVTSVSENTSDKEDTDLTLDISIFPGIGTKETVLIDTDEYKLTLKENFAPDTFLDEANGFFWFDMTIENKTDENLAFFFEDIEINGIDICSEEQSWTNRTNVDAGETTYAALIIKHETLLSFDITTVEEISFVLDAYSLVSIYEELGDLVYTSERLSFPCIPYYNGDVEEE